VLTVLIELPGGEGIVLRDDGEIVVTGDVNDESGSPIDRLDYRPITRRLDGDSSLVGGLLPPGACGAIAYDEVIAADGARGGRFGHRARRTA
jgi:hypothetical protein